MNLILYPDKFICLRADKLFIKIMKLTPILIIAFLQVAASGYSQKKMRVNFPAVTLDSLITYMESNSGYRFFYNSTDINAEKVLELKMKNATVKEILDRVTSTLRLSYKEQENQVIIITHQNSSSAAGITAGDSPNKPVANITITGTVQDSTGLPMPGVTILLESNKSIGTTTDVNGKFVLDVPENSTLLISLTGYMSQKITVGNKTVFRIIMHATSTDLDQVVITAFGRKQRKEAVVGSVTSISPKDLKIPASNLTSALAGRLAGIISYQRSGEPGKDNAQFFIRGITTFGVNNSPLILIDNIELTTTDLARLQPDDIASFSILKDASASALYGARGANGVILVTTKEGKDGKLKVNFRLENSLSAPTQTIKLADPITYMKLYTQAQLTRGDMSVKYSPQQIDHTIAGDNPYVYPKVDWQDMLFKKNTMNQRGNLSISGGGAKAQYYVSGSYNRDNGILKVPKVSNFNNNIKLNTYLLRSNVNINVTRTTQLIVRLYGTFDDYNGPIDGGGELYKRSLQVSPTAYPAFYAPDSSNEITQHILFGNYGTGQYTNPYADMVRGYMEYSQSRMLAQFELNQDMEAITPGLTFRGIGSTNRYAYFDVSRGYNPYYYNIGQYDKPTNTYSLQWLNETAGPTEYLNYNPGSRTLTTQLYLLGALDYNRTFFKKHNVSGSIITTLEQHQSPNSSSLQLSLPSRNTGISGRAAYGYDSKYFLEFNFGYNGSEKFYKTKQFGFFPVMGASWIISNEKFWSGLSNTISKLKLRGSYGMVGNDAIGREDQRFFYLSNVSLNNNGRGAVFGYNNGFSRPGVSISAYGNNDITWETSYDGNLALEIGIKGKANIIAEIYNRDRKNILMPRASIPASMGLSTTTYANVGAARTKGLDLSLDYTEQFNQKAWLTIRGNLTYSTSAYKEYEEPAYAEKYRLHPGQSLAQNWGFIAERLFIDEKDVQNAPKQNFGPYGAGDIKYADVNGDGQITYADAVPIGHPVTPEIIYGFGFSAGYGHFDISAFFQGSARSSFWIDPGATSPFINRSNNGTVGENALLDIYAKNHWSEENRDIYALWPRLSTIPVSNNLQTSTWFMYDGSFVRLKSLEIGYTLPTPLLKRLKAENLRVYFSGINLLTFSAFKYWDPEMGGDGLGYPVQKVFNIGINLNF
jgi:TonB-linked SusC/RagA family outer membrane protein